LFIHLFNFLPVNVILRITLLLVISVFLFSCQSSEPSSSDAQVASLAGLPAPAIKRLGEGKYGLPIEQYKVEKQKIKRNQFLADILTAHDVAYTKVDAMARKSEEVFDVRKMKAGNPYLILKNTADQVDYFIYEINKADYVVYDLRDEVEVSMGRKPTMVVEQEASGVIYSSLYQTIQENSLDVNLASLLEDVYAWSLDFFHTQKGDWFKVIYDEEFVEGQSMGIKTIKSAVFHTGEKDFFAFHFDENGQIGFYDEEGKSLRKAFLRAPLKYSRISSGFSYRRFHPVLKRYKSHLGVDYAAPRGTPIRSVGDGIITKASYTRGNGRYVKVKHNHTYATQYLHMSRIAKGIKPGVAVKQGEIIGYVGSTGLATGPHLCFRFWKNGRQVNPRVIDAPPTDPITHENETLYASVRDEMRQRLDQIPLDATENVLASN
jgi:murein DD-endopeptidase MepM/ murein hydrolase activator NlpD